MRKIFLIPFLIAVLPALVSLLQGQSEQNPTHSPQQLHNLNVTRIKTFGTHFQTSDRCVACHNGINTSDGKDISIGLAWRTSMMANSARDPYWIAGVRRETLDHPTAVREIEDECTICHMPMMRYESKLAGGTGEAFTHFGNLKTLAGRLADDGVSCSVCHQITGENLGTEKSFVGEFKIDEKAMAGHRNENGPYAVDPGHLTIMRSSSNFVPTDAGKQVIQSSELCATCHTLYTKALDAQGNVIGELAEQVPYEEWQHSSYSNTRSCQDCHMPIVEEDVPITSVLGEPRSGFSQHTFVGGNFFMQRILGRYRDDLAVPASLAEMETAANRTVVHLQREAANLVIRSIEVQNGKVIADISVLNLAGHKLPTAYPSRRAWLHVTVRDRSGRVVFESGALDPNGSITGNANDADALLFEPHYQEITGADQVQIYESIMGNVTDQPTTGLLHAVRYLKDNRLLPNGFDKSTAGKNIAVFGEANFDADFLAGGDTVRYTISTSNTQGPFQVEAELWYQPIAFRWAMNLKSYNTVESNRFVGYYEAMASESAVMLVRTAGVTR
jgi:hypothetical protein